MAPCRHGGCLTADGAPDHRSGNFVDPGARQRAQGGRGLRTGSELSSCPQQLPREDPSPGIKRPRDEGARTECRHAREAESLLATALETGVSSLLLPVTGLEKSHLGFQIGPDP